MNNYYFVAPSLPVLVLGEIPDMSFKEVMHRLEMNLSKSDLNQISVIRLRVDLENIRSLYLERPLDDHGNLNEKELDEALLVEADMPEYVFDFLNQFDEPEEKARHFFGLLSRYFAEEIPKAKGFLKKLLILQREISLVLTALRAKKLKRDIAKELQFEDFTDPFVAQILAQKDMDDYEPPIEYQDLKDNLIACGEDSWEQYRTVIGYEFIKIEEMTGYPLFTLEWILGYVARLLLVERWNLLDSEKGGEIVTRYKTGSES